MIDLKKYLLEASRHLEASGDKKVWARETEMRELLAAGAKVIILNKKQITGTYVTEVKCEGICFTHTSRDPLILTNPIFH